MTFEEYATKVTWRTVAERTKAKAVWEQAYLCGFSDSRKRIKLLEQRIIDLQGHDNLRYIDKKLSQQESE